MALETVEPAAGTRTASDVSTMRLSELHSAETEFRRTHPVAWAATLFGPFLLTAALIALLWAWAGWEFTQRLLTTTVLALWLIGRFIILSGADGSLHEVDTRLSSEQLFALVTYCDLMVALVLAFHVGFMFRIPWIGPRVAALITDGHFILDAHPWMRRAQFVGLVAFVMFPLTATGSVGGSIFGRLLGMSRVTTMVGILIGSLLGNGVMYVFSDLLGKWIDKDHPLVHWGGLAVVLLVVLLIELRYRRLKQIYVAAAESPAPRESL